MEPGQLVRKLLQLSVTEMVTVWRVQSPRDREKWVGFPAMQTESAEARENRTWPCLQGAPGQQSKNSMDTNSNPSQHFGTFHTPVISVLLLDPAGSYQYSWFARRETDRCPIADAMGCLPSAHCFPLLF